jgi:polysaccharide deacetylase family protein (PEP-CTERM system associated)
VTLTTPPRFADLKVDPVIAPEALRLFTVDVEDWFHSNFRSAPRLETAALPRCVEGGVARTLDILEEVGALATFFVLGVVADEHRNLVRTIVARGHEIGCHSWDHTLLYEQSPEQVSADLRRARELLQDQSGQAVLGFRAPSWSITERNLWALDVVAETGFAYDSSIFPAETYLYGIKNAPRFPYRVTTARGSVLLEVPPATIAVGPLRIGAGGGVYLRVLPFELHRQAMRACVRRAQPFVAYIHPRELDPTSWEFELPLSTYEGLIHRLGLSVAETRIRKLLNDGTWHPVRRLLGRTDEATARPASGR